MKQNEDLVGKRFGRLVIVSFASHDKSGKRKWLCRCDCGKEKVIYEQSVCRGATRSCGCYSQEQSRKRMSKGWAEIFTREYLILHHVENKLSLREIAAQAGCTLGCVMRYVERHDVSVNDAFYDIAGKKFGRLTVLSLAEMRDGHSYWNVECECGTKKVVQGKALVRRSILSCGCWNKEKCWKGCGDLSGSYWSILVREAVKRNLQFNLSIEYAWDLFLKQNNKCALSGREILLDRSYSRNRSEGRFIQTASLDRIDSRSGYLVGNVQWVHRFASRKPLLLYLQKFDL